MFSATGHHVNRTHADILLIKYSKAHLQFFLQVFLVFGFFFYFFYWGYAVCSIQTLDEFYIQ